MFNEYPKEENNERWEVNIERVSNGYLLNANGTTTIIEDTEDELESHENLLWEIMNFFDISGSKHDKERIKVIREKQK